MFVVSRFWCYTARQRQTPSAPGQLWFPYNFFNFPWFIIFTIKLDKDEISGLIRLSFEKFRFSYRTMTLIILLLFFNLSEFRSFPTGTAMFTSDIHLGIDNEGMLLTKRYDKRDYFKFSIMNTIYVWQYSTCI